MVFLKTWAAVDWLFNFTDSWQNCLQAFNRQQQAERFAYKIQYKNGGILRFRNLNCIINSAKSRAQLKKPSKYVKNANTPKIC